MMHLGSFRNMVYVETPKENKEKEMKHITLLYILGCTIKYSTKYRGLFSVSRYICFMLCYISNVV